MTLHYDRRELRSEIERQYVALPKGTDNSDWTEVQLADVCDLRAGSAFKKEYQGQTAGYYPFIKVSDMKLAANHVHIHTANNWIDEGVADHIGARPFPAETVVFAKIGEALKRNRLRRTIRPTIIDNNMMGAIPHVSRIDSLFLFYSMHQFDFAEVASGTALPYLTAKDLSRLVFPLPPLPEQRAIAHILGTLDDKIELIRRMNETLEALALELFKSWFVDFDPVRAKVEGRDIGLPQDIADLFPNRLVDSEMGEIPEGWPVATLAEHIEVNPRRFLRKGQTAPYLPMAYMPTRGHMPDVVAVRPFGSGMRFANGDTLVARITPCLENGKTAYVDFLTEGEVGWGSTEYIVLRPQPPLPNQFVYFLARSAGFRQFAIQNMSGTSGRQRVSPTALRGFLMVVPPSSVANRFGEVAGSLIERARNAGQESRSLATLRNTLLPKLISGEIRLGQTECTDGMTG